MNEATVLMWYDNSVLMTFLGVIVGGFIGFVGSIIQSHMTAKNNIDVVKAQSENEIEQHRYMEKEKLYSELIGFVPQFSFAIDVPTKRFSLSRDQKIQLNTFKARLAIFANQAIYDEFYDLIIFITKEPDSAKVVSRMDAFTEMLLEDLKQTGRQDKTKKKKKGSGA
jgi:hypothetical protein